MHIIIIGIIINPNFRKMSVTGFKPMALRRICTYANHKSFQILPNSRYIERHFLLLLFPWWCNFFFI